jgi:hypothetical protein
MLTIILKKMSRENSHLQKMPEPNHEYGYLIKMEVSPLVFEKRAHVPILRQHA